MDSASRTILPLVFEPAPAGNPVAGLVDVTVRGQLLEREGRWQDARALYRSALRKLSGSSAAENAQLMRWVARTHIQESELEPARAWAQVALALSEETLDEAGCGHAVNILAIVEWRLSNLDEAQHLYRRALASAHAAGEERLAAMAASNLGVIASVRGDVGEATRNFESVLASARGAGLVDQAIAALINLGLIHTRLGSLETAHSAFSEALELATVIGDMGMLITVNLEIAKLRIHQQRYDEAFACCGQAGAIAERTGHTHADGEAQHVRGLVAVAVGDRLTAEAHFLSAEEIAIQRSDLILEGETARELAGLYSVDGRNRQTLQRLNQAHRIFTQLRARRELADVDRRTTQLEADFLEVARKWGDTIESKDHYTQGHCVRVADLACALWSRAAEGDSTSLFWFRIGVLLHDVGKLMVPAEVLNKPGKLNAEEWALVRRHPSAGVELLADIEFPWDVRPIVQSHHEKWDGSGYPHGLAGEAIPLTARVVCIADVYDALTSRRSYKEPFTHEMAMEVMRKQIGLGFDPALFAQFEEMVRDGSWRAADASKVDA
ncbi:MAG: HD domain-containing phosphohydrolase [Gemmatimonadaceae bacterium]